MPQASFARPVIDGNITANCANVDVRSPRRAAIGVNAAGGIAKPSGTS